MNFHSLLPPPPPPPILPSECSPVGVRGHPGLSSPSPATSVLDALSCELVRVAVDMPLSARGRLRSRNHAGTSAPHSESNDADKARVDARRRIASVFSLARL